MKSTILHLLIGARLLHVASPEYRQKKAEREARKAAEKAELNEMATSDPLKFIMLMLCALCAIGVPFFLFYPGVSAWWSLACVFGGLFFFFLAIVTGEASSAS